MTIDLGSAMSILNATGIPLLAIGLILLIRAYQKSGDTYKETSAHLTSENERLRKRLTEIDLSYFDEVEKMRNIVSKSMEAIEELQTRKIALLSATKDAPNEAIFTDVEKINEVIKRLQDVVLLQQNFESQFRDYLEYVRREFQSVTFKIGKLTEQIGDNPARIALVSVMASEIKRDSLKSEIGDERRGLVPPIKNEPSSEDDENAATKRLAPPPPPLPARLRFDAEDDGPYGP